MVRANSEEMIKNSMLPPLHSLTLRSNRLGVPTGVKSEPKPKSKPKSEPKPSGEIRKQSAEYLRVRERFPDEAHTPVYRDRLGFGQELTCEVRYGTPRKHIPVPLKYESTDSVPREFPVKGLVTTRVTFRFDAKEGDELSLDGIPDRFYFPTLGLLPEWAGYPDMSPHEHRHWIPRPGDEGYDDDVEANEEEWNAVKDDEWKANQARGADNYEIVLDVRELAKTPSKQLTNRVFHNIRNRYERFTTDSILFADYLMFVSCGAQTILTDESRKKRYEINDDEQDDWSNHLNMPCKLKQLWVELEFWHPPSNPQDPESNPQEDEDPDGQHYFSMSSDPDGRPPNPYYLDEDGGGMVPARKRIDPYREDVFKPGFF